MSIWEENYNQYEEYYLRNACSIVTLLNIMKYNFAIFVVPNFIIKTAIFFERLKLFNPFRGAEFSPIYKAFAWYLSKKLGLNFEVVLNKISTLDDNRTYGIGIKGYGTAKWNKIKEDGIIDEADMDYLATFSGGVGHNAGFDNETGGTFIDTDGGKNVRLPISVLRYGLSLGLFWDNIRTISPADTYTATVTHFTVRLFQAEKKGKLEEYLKTNKDNVFVMKAKELYLYGR